MENDELSFFVRRLISLYSRLPDETVLALSHHQMEEVSFSDGREYYFDEPRVVLHINDDVHCAVEINAQERADDEVVFFRVLIYNSAMDRGMPTEYHHNDKKAFFLMARERIVEYLLYHPNTYYSCEEMRTKIIEIL